MTGHNLLYENLLLYIVILFSVSNHSLLESEHAALCCRRRHVEKERQNMRQCPCPCVLFGKAKTEQQQLLHPQFLRFVAELFLNVVSIGRETFTVVGQHSNT